MRRAGFVLIGLLTACGGGGTTTRAAPATPAQQSTKDELAALRAEVYMLRSDVIGTNMRVSALEADTAEVETDVPGYSLARNKFGQFTVSAKSC